MCAKACCFRTRAVFCCSASKVLEEGTALTECWKVGRLTSGVVIGWGVGIDCGALLGSASCSAAEDLRVNGSSFLGGMLCWLECFSCGGVLSYKTVSFSGC